MRKPWSISILHMADIARYAASGRGICSPKGRFLAAQLLAFLDKDLWLENARQPTQLRRSSPTPLPKGCSIRLRPMKYSFACLRGRGCNTSPQGFDFYDWGEGAARLVTSWHHREEDVQPLAKAIAAL
jgi:threonine aldolase